MRLSLDVDQQDFATQLSQEIAVGGLTVVDAIEKFLEEWLEESIAQAFGEWMIKAPRALVHPNYYIHRFQNLARLGREGYLTWYPEVRFWTKKMDVATVTHVDASGFVLGAIQYGFGVERQYVYKRKELKTQVNHTLRLNKLTLPARLFRRTLSLVGQRTQITQPYIAKLTVGCENFVDDRIEGYRAVAFDHLLTGERRYCSCHADAHAAMVSKAQAKAPEYAEYGWPHRLIRLLVRPIYSDGVCHFCVAERYGQDAPKQWYGSQFRKHFGPYVDLLIHTTDMDLPTAKAEAKRRLSISRWTREDDLYELITRLFPNHSIRREASPEWLGRQRLDIYLPELSLAIEHQGEQHSSAVDAFGGERALAKTLERDQRKRALCQAHGVTVIDIEFYEPLTIPHLRTRLGRWTEKYSFCK